MCATKTQQTAESALGLHILNILYYENRFKKYTWPKDKKIAFYDLLDWYMFVATYQTEEFAVILPTIMILIIKKIV